MKYCGSCGSENAATAKFCRGCGVAVTVGTTAFSADLPTKEELNWANWIGITALGGSLLACAYQFQQARLDWFVPVRGQVAASMAGDTRDACGYQTFGGTFAEVPRATRTGHFKYGDMATIGNDQGWTSINDRRGRLEIYNESGEPDAVTLENVAYDRVMPSFDQVYDEWELSPFSTYAPPVFVTGDGLQASTFGTHYPNVKSAIDGDPKRFFSNGLFGYKKGDGTDAISIRYDRASHFSSDYAAQVAAVSQNGKWGFVGPTGLAIKPFEYDDIQIGRRYSRDNYWTVKKDGRWGLLQSSGKNQDFGAMTLEQFDKVTPEQKAANISFNTVISPQFDYALPFLSNDQGSTITPNERGTLIAKSKSGWGFYDRTGTFKSDQYFSDISLPVEIETPGIFQALAGGFLWASLSRYGEKINIIAVETDGKWGFVDIDGNYLVEPNFGRPCGFISINESIGG